MPARLTALLIGVVLVPALLSPGTRIASHQFPMPGWPPDRRINVDESELLLWIIPKP